MGNHCDTPSICPNNSIEVEDAVKINEPMKNTQVNIINNFDIVSGRKLNSPTNREHINVNYIESYDHNNNFFLYLKSILLIQRTYKKYIMKQKARPKEKKSDKSLKNQLEKEGSLQFNIHLTKFSIFTKPNSLNSLVANGHVYAGHFMAKKKVKSKYLGYANSSKGKKNKEGYGEIKWQDGSILKGNFIQNFVNGFCSYKDNLNGSFNGEYSNNIPNGFGIFKNSGIIYQGSWYKNLMNGIGMEFTDNDTCYEGNFENSIKNGIGVFKWGDGTIYEGEWENNSMSGFGIIKYPNYKTYLGQVQDGLMNGYGEFYWEKEQKLYFGNYVNDKRCGLGCFVFSIIPLKVHFGFWEEGKINGPGIKISGHLFKYGVWKDGEKVSWLKGPWELRKYTPNDQVRFIKLLEKSQGKIMEIINKYIKLFNDKEFK